VRLALVGVGDVHPAVLPAAGEVPQQPGVGVAKIALPLSAASRAPSTFSRIH
jgi:hypothetical protein